MPIAMPIAKDADSDGRKCLNLIIFLFKSLSSKNIRKGTYLGCATSLRNYDFGLINQFVIIIVSSGKFYFEDGKFRPFPPQTDSFNLKKIDFLGMGISFPGGP